MYEVLISDAPHFLMTLAMVLTMTVTAFQVVMLLGLVVKAATFGLEPGDFWKVSIAVFWITIIIFFITR